MKIVQALSLIAAVGVAAGSSEAKEPSPSPTEFLAGNLHLADSSAFKLANVDLRGDGRREAIVYVTDPGYCGSGGCTLFVLAPRAGTYRIMMRATIVQLPIRLLPSSSHGWRDIGVTVSGGGITHPYEAALRFNGRRYPNNPTVPPANPRRRAAGELLIGP